MKAAKVIPLNDPTIYRVGAGDPRFVFVPGIVKPLAVGSVERAAFIVRACNAHDELVAALLECDTGPGAHCYRAGTAEAFDRRLCEINETIRAAIAKATQ